MSEPVRILIVEDVHSDFDLAQREIRNAIKECTFQQVETHKDFLSALETFQPDLILSDYNMPSFDGMTALKLAQEHAKLTPFIIWTGSSSEDVVVDCMKAGANNYILKENIKRLGPAVVYALEEGRLLRERNLIEQALRASQEQLHLLIEQAPISIAMFDLDMRYIVTSRRWVVEYGRGHHDLIGHHHYEIHPDLPESWKEAHKKGLAGEILKNDDDLWIQADGTKNWLRWAVIPWRNIHGEIGGIIFSAEDITERKQAEEAILNSEKRFRALIENGQDNISLLAADGTLLWESPATVRNLGYAQDEFVGHNIFDLMHPDDLKWTGDLYAKLIEEPGSRQHGAFRLRHSDGTWRWNEATATNLLNEPAVNAIVINYRDITNRKQAEIERQALLEIMQGLTNTDDLQEFLKLIHRSIASVIYAENFFVAFYNKNAGLFEEIYSVDKYDEPAPPSTLEKSITSYVFRTGKPLLLTQALFDKLAAQGEVELVGTNSESWMGAPLKTQNGTIGVIAVQDYENPNRYTERDKDFLALIGSQVALAIERRQAEESLRLSDQILQRVNALVLVADSQGSIVYLSPATRTILGYEPEELLGDNWWRFSRSDPSQAQREKEYVGRAARGEIPIVTDPYERAIVDRAGNTRWISWVDAAGPAGLLIGVGHDITERKQAELELMKRQARYQDLFDSSPVSLWEEDFSLVKKQLDELRQHGITDFREYFSTHPDVVAELASLVRITDANKASLELFRVERKEDLLKSLADVLNETTLKHFQDEILGLMSPLVRFTWEGTDRTMDGEQIEVIVNGSIPLGYEEDWSKVIVSINDITERKQMENALRARDALLGESQRIARLGHYRFDVLSGKWESSDTLNEVFGIDKDYRTDINGWASLVHPAHRDEMVAYFTDHVIKDHNPFNREYRIIRNNDGQVRWVHGLGRLEFDNEGNPVRMIGTVQDVTERKLAEEETLRHLIELEALYENGLAVGQLLTPREIGDRIISTVARYLSWHHVTIRLRKKESDELELVAFNLPDPKEEARAETERHFKDMINKVGQGMSGWVVQTGIPIRTGNVHAYPQYMDIHEGILSGLYMPLKIGESVIGCISVESELADAFTAQDERLLATLANQAAVAFENARLFQAAQQELAERMRAEELLERERISLAQRVDERTADLSRANSNLARALRVKDEFLANMSHELRTPLNAILGLSESLGEQTAGPLNEKQQKYITTISESGHHLLSLINDILDLAKIEAGQITLDINKMDIQSVCQASLRMIKQLAQNKNQDVTLIIDDGLGLMWADERRLKQMIVNLLGNAVKFTPEDGKIGMEVHGDRDENKVTITVWDNGIGIKESDLLKVFQPFVQLDAGFARGAPGTGLGLALVAQMARLHGGSVSVTSQPGIGSRFTIVLPWEPALAADTASRLRSTGKFRAVNPNAENKQTILLIEDTEEVTMMLRDYVELAGYKVVTAHDGLDGLTQAKLSQPDLILMDIQMPRMDGFEATKRLRSDPDFKYTPIIALTALAMPSDRERCLAAGMDEYISKPVNLKALVKIIQGCLSKNDETRS